ncbi:hypothetical protein AF376_23155, partial [Salmonella enterica subsp. enterica serovar Typhimurium]
IENAPEGGNVIQLATELKLAIGLLLIENVATVRIIDHATVVAANRHRYIGLQRALDQCLHRGDVNYGAVYREIVG